MSRDRGHALQRALADYLRAWWPSAESTPNGRAGSDVLGTPGIVWENKTPRRFDPYTWAAQAAGHVRGGELPVCVYWPDGVGNRRPELALAIVPLPELVDLLILAGYAGPVTDRNLYLRRAR
jgi:hypothetical protein